MFVSDQCDPNRAEQKNDDSTIVVEDANRGTHPRRLQSELESQVWDPSFNAVTGRNGSGKSNILGLTNMSSVRVPHHLCNTLLLIMPSSLRYLCRINGISLDKAALPKHLSPSSLTTQTGETAPGMENYGQIT